MVGVTLSALIQVEGTCAFGETQQKQQTGTQETISFMRQKMLRFTCMFYCFLPLTIRSNPLGWFTDEAIIDYNIYWQNLTTRFMTINGVLVYTTQDFATYQQEQGQDQNSQLTDPLFESVDDLDFRLQQDSPAIDAGTTISGETEDFVGTSVPQGSGTDIGAFEYVSVISDSEDHPNTAWPLHKISFSLFVAGIVVAVQ